jgi:YihY family inner membrane protein
MDLSRPLRPFDRFQQRHAVLAIPIAVLRKFSDDQAGGYAALIAYYAFVAIFPLLLVFTTILGFVLQNDPDAYAKVVDTTLAQIPVIGESVRNQTLRGSGVALAVGLVGTLLAGLGVTVAAQNALNHVYAVPRRRRPDPLMSRLRGLAILCVLGALQVVSTAVSGLAAGGLGGMWTQTGGLGLSVVVNAILFTAAFRLLVDSTIATRELWPGVALATVGWTALQALGGIYVTHVIADATDTYGTFATVLGLIAWLYLGARVVVYAAEINTVLSRRLWPRSLFTPPVLEADRRVLTDMAKAQARIDQEHIDVRFDEPDQSA